MSVPLHFSRVQLRRDASAASLAPLLVPRHGESAETGHRLVWSLFADGGNRNRDFLFRERAAGSFFILSNRKPVNEHKLFEVETKPFEPCLAVGERLGFSLRVNPVVARSMPGERHPRRDDAVMSLKKKIARGEAEDPGSRYELERRAGCDWLDARSAKNGFALNETELTVAGYRTHSITRTGAQPVRFASLDLEGYLTIESPVSFLAAVTRGFGAAKAFGCGLMLLRRPND